MDRWPRQILFGDVDAMYASAAVVADPSLADKPIAVGSPPPRGIITAASYAVRPFGVRSAMPTVQALRLCPQLILVPMDRPLYRRLHEQMRAVIDRLVPITEWTSIDEFYAETTSLQARYPDPRVLGRVVKEALFESTGLRCTVALATSKTVAKIAADAHKPDGLAVIPPGTEQSFLARQSFRALPGIGPKTATRLEPLGIRTIGDFLEPRFQAGLAHLLGPRLPGIQLLAQGIDHDAVVPDRESKSVSHETTFDQDTSDRSVLERTVRSFLVDLARELRQEGLAAGTFTVKLKDSRFRITTRQRQFPRPLNYDPTMWLAIQSTLHELMKPNVQYRLVGLTLSSVVPTLGTLFDQRRTKAVAAMDALAAKHGPKIIGLGGTSAD